MHIALNSQSYNSSFSLWSWDCVHSMLWMLIVWLLIGSPFGYFDGLNVPFEEPAGEKIVLNSHPKTLIGMKFPQCKVVVRTSEIILSGMFFSWYDINLCALFFTLCTWTISMLFLIMYDCKYLCINVNLSSHCIVPI